jgi:3,4-dihydroxy 2-butanone 4-phosphate synthase/GTP cyclohydrolase II
LDALADRGLESVMVEGGTEVISSFMHQQIVDHLILTVAPMFVGGKPALANLELDAAGDSSPSFPRLEQVRYRWMGEDLVLEGTPAWSE